VPLACLIEHLGLVCLVKAAFPSAVPTLKNKCSIEAEIVTLQERTRISNSILFINECEFRDLT
jgi:hypothetical protein